MWREIGDAFRLLGSMGDGCRCILLTGNGKGFCAGIDVSDPKFELIGTRRTNVGVNVRRSTDTTIRQTTVEDCFVTMECGEGTRYASTVVGAETGLC